MKDLIIVGGGPAGLTAAIYASRYKMDFLVLSKESGGQVNETHKIENWPGIESISGFELGQKFLAHAKSLGAEVRDEIVNKVEKIDGGFKVISGKGEHQAKNVLFALGTNYRRLSVPGEKKFFGKGVSYCATCDGPFFKDRKVAVIGGGNSAAGAASVLSEYASEVNLYYRGEESQLGMTPSHKEQIDKSDKINLSCCTEVKEIKGDGRVKSVVLTYSKDGKRDGEKTENEVETDGVFIEIGSEPNVEMILSLGAEVDEKQFVKVGADQSTNVPGIYAAGDITTGSNRFRQIVTAASEGAIATLAIYDKTKEESTKK